MCFGFFFVFFVFFCDVLIVFGFVFVFGDIVLVNVVNGFFCLGFFYGRFNLALFFFSRESMCICYRFLFYKFNGIMIDCNNNGGMILNVKCNMFIM